MHAPNGTVPVAYLTKDKPPSMPTSVYCDERVQLGPENSQALTDARRGFDLPTLTTGKQYLVLQKGGFRRVREIQITTGEHAARHAYHAAVEYRSRRL